MSELDINQRNGEDVELNELKHVEDVETKTNKRTYTNYSHEIKRLNQKIDFMNHRMDTMITEKLSESLENEGARDYLFKIAKKIVDTEIRDIITQVITDTLSKLDKKIKLQLKISHEICLSMDTEIKSLVRELDCSYSTDKKIYAVLDKHIQRVSEQLTINDEFKGIRGCIDFDGSGEDLLKSIRGKE